jgi:Asp/Glu/hydantoin racemase
VRIWHQSMGSVQMNDVGGPIIEHARKVVEDGTEVVVHGLPAPADYVTSVESIRNGTASAGAVTTIDVIGSAYLYNITLRQAIETARQAEREGYDAYVIGSWTDPFVREMRSAVDIPVVSTAEASLLLASSFGKLQGHISLNATMARVARERAAEYGVADRVVALSALGDDMDEWVIQRAWNKPQAIIARFTELAEQAITAGADVIIPVEGIITEFFHANSVTRVKDAPVLDTFGLAWKYAEFLVNLRNKTGLTVSRQWEYRKASDTQTARVRAALGLDA